MRNPFLLLAFTLSPFLLSAQPPVYLMFTQDCVDQLEYRAAYGAVTTLIYSVHPTTDAQFFLTAGVSGITSPTKPEGARTCYEFTINDAFADVINKGTRQVYMVHQASNGYMLMPIIACTQVTRYGAVYQFRAPNYGFAVDTSNLVNEQNLAAPNSSSYIYFNGIKFRDCYNQYSFRRVPATANMERADFDFIAGVGITSDKTGKTASDAESNWMRLTKVNGVALDDYITNACKNKTRTPPASTVTKWSGEAKYGPANPYEMDKETASILVGPPQPLTNSSNSPLPVECTEAPGYGYHLVMPGESLNAIARSYRVDVKDLVKWNKIKNANKLAVCQKVWLMKPMAGSNMVSMRKDAVSAPAPVAHSTPAAEYYAGPTVVRQDYLWNQQAKQPQAYSNGNVAPVVPSSANSGYISPVVYSTTSSTPAGNAPTVVRPPQPFTHTVRAGETVSGISRYYGISEECMRYQNSMAATGDVIIYPNQVLTISMCQTGTMPTVPTPTPTQYNYNPPTPIAAPAINPNYIYNQQTKQYEYNPRSNGANYIYNPATGLYDYKEPEIQTVRPGAFLEGTPNPQQPAQYNAPQPTPFPEFNDRPDVFDETTPVNGGNAPDFTSKGNSVTPATKYYTEHVVQQGENLRAVAMKFNISEAELRQLNSLADSESVMPGKRLVVPRL